MFEEIYKNFEEKLKIEMSRDSLSGRQIYGCSFVYERQNNSMSFIFFCQNYENRRKSISFCIPGNREESIAHNEKICQILIQRLRCDTNNEFAIY